MRVKVRCVVKHRSSAAAIFQGPVKPTETCAVARRRTGDALLHCRVTAVRPHRLRVADTNALPSEQEGLRSLAMLLEVCSRREVGWSLQTQLHTVLVLAATERAMGSGRPAGELLRHSAPGGQ
jgi:hypothetical protein